MSLYRCPVCGGSLVRGERTYRCPGGHCYDIANIFKARNESKKGK